MVYLVENRLNLRCRLLGSGSVAKQTAIEKTGRLDEGLYNAATVRFRSQGLRTVRRKNHETCGQDVDPDGRFGLHVRGNRDPDA